MCWEPEHQKVLRHSQVREILFLYTHFNLNKNCWSTVCINTLEGKRDFVPHSASEIFTAFCRPRCRIKRDSRSLLCYSLLETEPGLLGTILHFYIKCQVLIIPQMSAARATVNPEAFLYQSCWKISQHFPQLKKNTVTWCVTKKTKVLLPTAGI